MSFQGPGTGLTGTAASLSIGGSAGSLSTTYTAGRILYGAGSGVPTTTSTFFYDSANGRLGIGTASPGAVLTVYGGTGTPVVHIHDSSGGPDYGAAYGMVNLTRGADAVKAHVAFIRNGYFVWQMGYIQNNNAIGMFPGNFSGTQGTPTMTWSGGNVGIGTTNPGSPLIVFGSTSTVVVSMQSSVSSLDFQCGSRLGINISGWSTIDPNGSGTSGVGIWDALAVGGWAAIGASYAQSATVGPSNGLIVQGNVGIGTASPGVSLDVVGNLRQTSLPVLHVFKTSGFGDQTVSGGTNIVTFGGTTYNTQWTLTSTSRFTLTGPSGYYLITGRLQTSSAFAYMSAAIYVNGFQRAGPYAGQASNGTYTTATTNLVYLLNTNDYIEIYALCSGTIILQSSGGGDARCALQAVYLSGTT